MVLKIPEEFIAQQPADPLESRVGVEGYLKNLRDMVFGSGPEAALSPGNFLAPVGMGRIPKELLDSVINARGKKFHGTQSLGDLIEIVTGGLNAGKTPSNLGRVSTSRSPHVSYRFGPFIVELNPEMIRTRPIAEPGFRKKNAASFEAEEGLLAAQPEAIDRILVDQDQLDRMFKTARRPPAFESSNMFSPVERQNKAKIERSQYEALIDFAVANNIPVTPFAGRKEVKLSKLVNTKRPGVEPRRGSPTAPRPLERTKDIEFAKAELQGQKAPFTNVLDQMDELMSKPITDQLGDLDFPFVDASKPTGPSLFADFKPAILANPNNPTKLPIDVQTHISEQFGKIPAGIDTLGKLIKFAFKEGDTSLAQWIINHPQADKNNQKFLKQAFGDTVTLPSEFDPGQ